MTHLTNVSIANEVSVNPQNGIGKSTITGLSRIVGVSKQVLSEHFQYGSTKPPSKLAQLLIEYGFKPVNFAEEGVPDIAVAIVTYYYACETNKPTPEAKVANLIFSSRGARDWMQKLKGYSEKVEKTETELYSEANFELAKKIGASAPQKCGI